MSSELVSFGLEEEKLLQELQFKKIMAMSQELQKLKETISIQYVEIETQKRHLLNISETLNNNISEVKDSLQKQIEKQSYQENQVYGDYVGQGGLGSIHSPIIGAAYMGKLLHKAGITRENGSSRPYAKYFDGDIPMIVNKTTETGYLFYHFHHEKTWKVIKAYLTKMGYLDGFEACKTKKEIHSFINEIN